MKIKVDKIIGPIYYIVGLVGWRESFFFNTNYTSTTLKSHCHSIWLLSCLDLNTITKKLDDETHRAKKIKSSEIHSM